MSVGSRSVFYEVREGLFYKREAADERHRSLVGSEMCMRERREREREI